MKKIKVISEKYIINKYLRNLNFNKIETFNFKNDAAYLKIPKNKQLVVTNDTISESVDFFKNDPPESLANKIVTYNLSDISSMGASPYSYTLSLCLPKSTNDIWLKKFTRKLFFLQKKYNVFLIGGDLSSSHKIIISSNFFGFVSKGKGYQAAEGGNDDLVMALVLFSWVTSQRYFKDLLDQDLRLKLYTDRMKSIEDDLLPFGIISDGLGQDGFVDTDGTHWSYV